MTTLGPSTPSAAVEAEKLDHDIGERVRRARKARGLTQTELGGALGVTFQQIQKYERGVNRISSSALVLIARALGVAPAELMGVDDAPRSTLDLSLPEGTDDLLRSYRDIRSPQLRRAVLALASRLAAVSDD